jgi:hypothetical protein
MGGMKAVEDLRQSPATVPAISASTPEGRDDDAFHACITSARVLALY